MCIRVYIYIYICINTVWIQPYLLRKYDWRIFFRGDSAVPSKKCLDVSGCVWMHRNIRKYGFASRLLCFLKRKIDFKDQI